MKQYLLNVAIAALLLALAAPAQAQDFYGTINTGFRAKSQGDVLA